ncbi:pleckstrin homology domain-containing family G member 3 isoform X3 [Mugil cephalus]|uniref:pleckstrin homology domain-containing family G member 3 isoform X3 n=1 Tax=Mugil cephalus TaxID=48193 RepID=UPI001FB7E680|nr:pleckstrin homology domain-containing family G member 3 isoform X3 [Mugil cephalus]
MPEGSLRCPMGEGGRPASLLFRYLTRPSGNWFAESPRLSTASISSDERAPSATPSDSSDRRPASLISTLSSGSGSSRDDNTTPPPPSTTEGLNPDPNRKGRSFVHNNNNNNKQRASSQRQPASPFVRGTMAPNPQLTYLDRVVMEIIETERMYVRDLRMIVEDYLAHIIDQADLSIRPEQVCSLFGNIEDIYEFNSELLQDLDMCDNDPVAVARCFVTKSEYFEIYTQYCTNYPNSVAALTDCMRNKSLAKFFRERQASLKRSLPLGSYLLKPVQRILKYHLLLQEIAKHFDPEEEGYEVVEDAIYTMTGVAWYINDMKRKHEHAVRLQEVQSLLLNWKGPDLTTYGELVLEGTFKVPRAKNERTLFLFDRMLLITKRRGEHYVYKAHISCSTLMLIESAKDSLSFSVTHYKHPKQPHTVQAKTVEEKKLWAHHIKRIILENHHAIIPQKAKEAILEMDSIYPSRYRYSPERLKKALSSQSDEFPRDTRQGRRQSEPIRQKSSKVLPQHSDSETVASGDRRSLQPTVSSFTLGSRGLEEDEEEEEEEEELSTGKDSLERLLCSEEEEEEEVLLEEQEDDFATSVLAAISCWHYRVQAFLSISGTEAEGGGVVSSNSPNKENGRLPEEDESTESSPEQPAADELPREELEPQEAPEPEPSSDLDPTKTSASPQKFEEAKSEPDPEPVEELSSATPDSDSKTLSSEDSSEDEGDEKEAVEKEVESPSILPSSVLDKAGAIAQHFTNSIKRGSLVQDDTRSLGGASPRLPSRTGSSLSLSLSTEPAERPPRLNSVSSDPVETFGATDLTLLSPREDSLFDAERSIRRRRDSTLSKQDQLLIGKIKSYYENAGSQDATFSLQRRESLTYIPTGLVRSSVSRFNSIPREDVVQTDPSSSGLDASSETQDHMVSSDSLDSLRSDHRSTGPEDSGESPVSRSQSIQEIPSEDEEFRPSSEMIKIWQAMEKDLRSQSEDRGHSRSGDALKTSRVTSAGLPTPTKSWDQRSGASDLSTITESTDISAFKPEVSRVNRPGSLKFGEEAAVLRAPVPRFTQLRAEAEGERPSEDSNQPDGVDMTKSKVLHLARQYSQRIKTTRPIVRQRSQGLLTSRMSLASVMEEESSGKPALTLPLVSHNQRRSPVDQVQSSTPSLMCRSRVVVSPGQARSRSPLSPPPIEGFNWPDVSQLRSKYFDHGRSQKSPVCRSRSSPDQMFDGGLRRHSSCSSSLPLSDFSDKPHGRGDAGREERSKRLHRANSLDPRLSRAQMAELQRLQDQVSDGYYVSAEAPLPNDPHHRILVVEKLLEPEETKKTKEEEDDDSYVQIRSPTSREKISIVAVVDRCRVYLESDQYKQRHQDLEKTEHDESQKTRPATGQKTESGLVKNLREKFQSLG